MKFRNWHDANTYCKRMEDMFYAEFNTVIVVNYDQEADKVNWRYVGELACPQSAQYMHIGWIKGFAAGYEVRKC